MWKYSKGRQSGFTLVELIAAMAILMLLTSVALPLARVQIQRAREVELRRDLRQIREAGVEAMANYRAMHGQTLFHERLGTKLGDFPNAERIGADTISLPLYPALTCEEVDEVAGAIASALATTPA